VPGTYGREREGPFPKHSHAPEEEEEEEEAKNHALMTKTSRLLQGNFPSYADRNDCLLQIWRGKRQLSESSECRRRNFVGIVCGAQQPALRRAIVNLQIAEWHQKTGKQSTRNSPCVYHACSTLDAPQGGEDSERLKLVLVCLADKVEYAGRGSILNLHHLGPLEQVSKLADQRQPLCEALREFSRGSAQLAGADNGDTHS